MYNSPEYNSMLNVARTYVREIADPKYDMKRPAGKTLGQGNYGQAQMGYDKDSVLKRPIEGNTEPKGNIGREEMAAMERMDGTPGFPRLLNKNVKEKGKEYEGDIAISLAKGQTLTKAKKGMSEKEQQDIHKKLIGLRKQMHQKGVSHNDMHTDNIFVDDDKNASVIDFGKAKIDPLAALGEAMGSLNGGDVAFHMTASGGRLEDAGITDIKTDPEMNELLSGNHKNVMKRLQKLRDSGESDDEDMTPFANFMQHSGGEHGVFDHSQIKKDVKELANDDFVYELINMFYDGVGKDSTSDRMARGFRDLKNIKSRLGRGGNLRRGEVNVPSRNLEGDD